MFDINRMFDLSNDIFSCGKFAADEFELIKKRKELENKMNAENQSSSLGWAFACDGINHNQEQPCSSANAQFWYERDVALLEAEKEEMAKHFSNFELEKLDDGRLCWVGALPLSDNIAWTVMVVYENDYDGATNKNESDISVKVYSIEPNLDEIIAQQPAVFSGFDNILQDAQGNYYFHCFNKSENASLTAAGSLMLASRYTKVLEKVFVLDENSNSDKSVDPRKIKKATCQKPKHIVFSNRAFVALLAETKEKFTTETGGIFLGIMRNDIWFVIESIDPGPQSIFQPAYFEYDGNYVRHLANKVNRLYGDRLDVIGLWHRHPGSMDVFSNTDHGTIKKFAEQNRGVTISALVNIDPNFRLTMYVATLGSSLICERISYEVDDNKIPKEVASVLNHIDIEQNINAMSSGERIIKQSRKVNFINLLVEYLKKLEYCELVKDIAIDNSEEERNLLIDEYLANECFFCEEKNISFTCDTNSSNLIELIIEESNASLRLLFCIFDFPIKDEFIKRHLFANVTKKFRHVPEIEKITGRHRCFIYNSRLYLYEGDLLKTIWEASK